MKTLSAIGKEKNYLERLQSAAYVLSGLLVLALLSVVTIPLPFTPVPIVLQSMAILLCGAVLTPRLAAITVALFLAQGLVGLPVFSIGPTFGLARFLGPTGGYLIGYFLAAVTIASLRKKGWPLYLSLVLGTLCIWLMGALHLATFIGMKGALLKGVLPFIPGDIVKILLVGKIAPRLREKISL